MRRELREDESLDAERVARLQLDRLSALLAHCYDNVPYYRAMFDELGAHPSDIRTLQDYAHLPMLDRDTLREKAASFVATNFNRDELVYVTTGGSTGEAVQLHMDQRYRDWGWAAFLRNVEWAGHRTGERQVWFTRPDDEGWPRRVRLELQRHWYVGVRNGTAESVASWAEAVRRHRPRFVYGYPHALAAIADYMLDRDRRFEGVHQVMVGSETLYEQQRKRIELAFGSRVYNQYGANECYSIASECRHGSMHVNSDINLIEFSPLDSQQEGDGAHEVVVTPLLARGMPLLRYRIGDEASAVPGQCACGLPFPLMRLDIGRLAEMMVFSNGRILSTMVPAARALDIPAIARFQFRQNADDSLDLLIVRAARGGESLNEALIRLEDDLAKEAGFRIEVRPTFVDEIPLTPAGKHKYVIPLGRPAGHGHTGSGV
jgi:phenylacetate-CoA ligase